MATDTAAPASFKTLIKDGTLKRGDLIRAKLDDINVERGFNLRLAGAELEEHITGIFNFIMDGGTLPPLEVRVADDGRVLVVDGHCRLAAYKRAKAAGAELDYIDVLPFRGNDADRVARILHSASGRPLSVLETALGYKRLAGFKLTPEDIGKKFSKTRQHVDQLLILANANTDVHQLVADGKVSAATAINLVRKNGEAAGKLLLQQLGKAEGAGKRKVTAGTMNGKKLPAKCNAAAIDAVDTFMREAPKEVIATCVRVADGSAHPDTEVTVKASALFMLMDADLKLREARSIADDKVKRRAAKAAQKELPT